jgi:hypothetical protein
VFISSAACDGQLKFVGFAAIADLSGPAAQGGKNEHEPPKQWMLERLVIGSRGFAARYWPQVASTDA